MTIADYFAAIRRFDRLTRAQLEEVVVALEEQRDRALGKARAQKDALASWLETRADSHDADAVHAGVAEERRLAHRMTAAELRSAADDIQEAM